MRVDPSILYNKDTKEATDARVRDITRKAAIAFVLLVEIAIFIKMLI